MKNRIILGVLGFAMICTAVLAAGLYGPVCKASESCRILGRFVGHVQRAEWSEAQAMLQTDPDWFRIEDGRVIYCGSDYTKLLAGARPLFWKTLVYYLTDRAMADKVIFFAYTTDYAKLKDGKITFLKIP